MKNANYNLIKMLLAKLDDTWRIEKHYAKDAQESACTSCQDVLKKIHEADMKHVDMLRKELAKHVKGGVLE
jgi:hypothetical protein